MGRILTAVGALEAREKVVAPTTRMEFLGNVVDTIKMTLEVAEYRVEELTNLVCEWKNMNKFTLKQLQSLIGKLAFVTNCVRPGRIFLSRLLKVLREFPVAERSLPMQKEMLNDLQWWEHFLPRFDGSLNTLATGLP